MYRFDQWVIQFVNSFAQRSWVADATVVRIADNVFLVGAVLMAMFWWTWVEYGKQSIEKRKTLLVNIFATAFAVLVARVLALTLPFRQRPQLDTLLHFQLPYTAKSDAIIHGSSFPSDHAVVSFCVAAGLWMVSRRLGTFAFGYAALINLPRIYLGVHYPTDILAGALLGMGIAFLCDVPILRKSAGAALDCLDHRPAFLYCFLFLATFEIGEMFDSLRQVVFFGARLSLHYPHRRIAEVAAVMLLGGLLAALAWLIWRKSDEVHEDALSPYHG